jgi:hypothetical protein
MSVAWRPPSGDNAAHLATCGTAAEDAATAHPNAAHPVETTGARLIVTHVPEPCATGQVGTVEEKEDPSEMTVHYYHDTFVVACVSIIIVLGIVVFGYVINQWNGTR